MVDEVAYDIIALYGEKTADEIVAAMMEKYGHREDVTEEELRHLHNIEKALDRVYNSGRFRRTAEYAAWAGGLTMFGLYEHISAIFELKTMCSVR